VSGRHRKTLRSPPRHVGRHRKPPSRRLTVLPTVTVVALLAVGGVGLGPAFANDAPHVAAAVVPLAPSAPPPVIASSPPSPVAVPSSPSPPPSPTPKPKPSRPPAHHTRHHRIAPAALTVTDLGPACYLEVKTASGHLLTRRILHGHERVTFRQHRLHVVLGNAGAVRIAIDGHPGHRAGQVGQVRVFKIR
jgi:hypothetical protein